MCLMDSNIANLFPNNMIDFDALDFGECRRSEEVMSFFWRSV